MKFIKHILITEFISIDHFFNEFKNISLKLEVETRKGGARMQLFSG
jgi:hypothetical protein